MTLPTPSAAASNPVAFAAFASRGRWKAARHLRWIGDQIQRVVRGDILRLVVSTPPRHGKSSLISHYLPAWWLGTHPQDEVLLVSMQERLTLRWARQARDDFALHGEKLWGVTTPPRASPKEWEVYRDGRRTGGVLQATGANGTITGKGAHLLIVDDLIKSLAEARSETLRETTWEWFQSACLTRLMPPGRVVILSTRWHHDDLIGRLMSLQARGELGEPWTFVNLPAICDEPGDPLGRALGEPLWPERFSAEWLARKRKDVGPYTWECTPAETPILMADWTEKPISEVRPGDLVMGFTRYDDRRRTRVPSRVRRVFSKQGCVFTYHLESGRSVRCTPDHRWYTGRSDARFNRTLGKWTPGHQQYAVPKVGRKLMLMCPTTPTLSSREREAWQYLAGLIDGEGCVQDSAITIAQSPSANPEVWAGIKTVLGELGLSYRERVTHPEWRRRRNWGLQGVCVLRDPFGVSVSLLRHTRIAKANQLREKLTERGRHFVKAEDRIIGVEECATPEPVYALETETGNYVAWGYASSNSLYQGRPSPLSGAIFKRDWFSYYDREGAYEKTVLTLRGRGTCEAKTLHRFATVDLATSKDERSDYTVVATWGFHPAWKVLVLLDLFRDRLDGPAIPRVLERAWAEWRLAAVYAEREGPLLEEKLGHVLKEAARDGVPIVELRPEGDKESRAYAATGAFAGGQVFFPARAPWLAELEVELLTFPDAKYDDQVDVTTYACAIFRELAATGLEDEKPRGPGEAPWWNGAREGPWLPSGW